MIVYDSQEPLLAHERRMLRVGEFVENHPGRRSLEYATRRQFERFANLDPRQLGPACIIVRELAEFYRGCDHYECAQHSRDSRGSTFSRRVNVRCTPTRVSAWYVKAHHKILQRKSKHKKTILCMSAAFRFTGEVRIGLSVGRSRLSPILQSEFQPGLPNDLEIAGVTRNKRQL